MHSNQKTAIDPLSVDSKAGLDRRREPRQRARGKVVVRIDQGKTVIHGEMIDVSSSGFRIRYHGNVLEAGADVDISYPWGEVKASIVWVRAEGGWTEVGFLLLN
jgi:PilZ domain